MCHNFESGNEQIEKCIESGMPNKLVRTLKNTMKKRIAATKSAEDSSQSESDRTSTGHANVVGQLKPAFQMQCPFAHGRNIFAGVESSGVTDKLGNPKVSYELFSSKPYSTEEITNLSGHNEIRLSDKAAFNEDILAKSTQLTRRLTLHMQLFARRLRSSRTYTLLTRTTQPVHVVALCILMLVLLTLWPDLSESNHRKPEDSRKYALVAIAYLGAFSTHFGSQIWMTFVSGLSLYFSLPRHIFGQCQQILFPKYFALNGALSITMLILFVKFFLHSWNWSQCVQLSALFVTGFIEVAVRLYFAPPLLQLMHEKYKIEDAIGSGKEVGTLVQGDLIQCPHYQRIHKAFRRVHMTVAIGNLITMAASCLHLYYIASQVTISL